MFSFRLFWELTVYLQSTNRLLDIHYFERSPPAITVSLGQDAEGFRVHGMDIYATDSRVLHTRSALAM